MRALRRALSMAPLLGLLAAAAPAQVGIEAEDLAPPETTASPTTTAAVEARLAEAEALFASAAQADSLPVLDEVVATLESQLDDPAKIQLLIRALSLRAQVQFNFGDNAAAEADIARVLVLEPAFSYDAGRVSPKLVQLVERVASRTIARLQLAIEPPDATVRARGREIEAAPGAMVPVLAGELEVAVERPGFAPFTQHLVVEPGAVVPLAVILERRSGVVWVTTEPGGAAVALDEQPAGTTPTAAPGEPAAALGLEVAVGDHILTVSLPDHRTQRLSVVVPQLADYRLQTIELERAEGRVRLEGLPAGTTVLVDDARVSPAAGGSELRLPPGRRRIAVDGGIRGQFEATVDLADRQELALRVELRPALALAGVIGGDRVAAERAISDLRQGIADTDWTLLDRAESGSRAIASLGVDASVLRSESGARKLDWPAIQRRLGELSPASLHLIGVLSDDLVASTVDLVFLPAAPAVALIERRRVSLDDAASVRAALQPLTRPIRWSRPALGAQIVDGVLGPVVAAVRAGGPAEAAGLRGGEEIVAVGGRAVSSAAEAAAGIAAAEPGSPISLSLRLPEGTSKTLELVLPSSPAAVRPDDERLLYAAVAARIAAARVSKEAPDWVLDLNEASVLLHGRALEEAIRRLRSLEAPSGPGLGREAGDYWLGVALAAAGPSYREAAKAAFGRAAARPDATLGHADGPLVAPAANARILALGDTSSP